MELYLNDFEYLKQGEDMTLPVTAALDKMSDGDTLHLCGGVLHFYPEFASEDFYFISNNDCGQKKILFLLKNKENITVDGDGAKLIFHGKMMPFAVDKCKGISIRNLTVDYAEPMYFEAKIIDSGENFVEMEYDDGKFNLDIKDGIFRFFGENWENVTNRVLVNEFDPGFKGPTPYTPTYFACLGDDCDSGFMSGLYRMLVASKPQKNRLRLEGEIRYRHTVGNYWLCTHNSREYPGIFVNESEKVAIMNVTLNHTLAMGIICQLSGDIKLVGVEAYPSEGRMLSVDADATHFVNCFGDVELDGCRFESMMDDAGNFHGIYMPVKQKTGTNSVLLHFGHFQQEGINIFKKGDKISLNDNTTLEPYGYYTVKCSRLISSKYVLLETEEALPETVASGHVFENISRMPSVHISGCRCGYNRPRGFLISTPKTAVIENCEFYNMNSAVYMEGDANSWFESGACGEVIIRGNRFENAAYAGGAVIYSAPNIGVKRKPFHKNITVTGNVFRMAEKRFLQMRSAENVVFRDNVFDCDKTLPCHGKVGENGFLLTDCVNTDIEEI